MPDYNPRNERVKKAYFRHLKEAGGKADATIDAVRKAISLGGDADTLACITGGIAEAHYGGVPPHIANGALQLLDDRLRRVVQQFGERYPRSSTRSL